MPGIIIIFILIFLGYKQSTQDKLMIEIVSEIPFSLGYKPEIKIDIENIYFYTNDWHIYNEYHPDKNKVWPQIYVFNLKSQTYTQSLKVPLLGFNTLTCAYQNRAIYSNKDNFVEVSFEKDKFVISDKKDLSQQQFSLDCFPINIDNKVACEKSIFLSFPLLKQDGILNICKNDTQFIKTVNIQNEWDKYLEITAIDPISFFQKSKTATHYFGLQFIQRDNEYFLYHKSFFNWFAFILNTQKKKLLSYQLEELSTIGESRGLGAGYHPISFYLGNEKIAAYMAKKIKILENEAVSEIISSVEATQIMSLNGKWLYFIEKEDQENMILKRINMD